MSDRFRLIVIILLLLWISFLAPIVERYLQFMFFIVLLALLSISICLDKNFYKLIFNKTEIPFWAFLLTMIGGIIVVKESAVAYRHFWSFIFPIPFLFYSGKIAFEEKYGVLIIRSICLMALLISIYGIIEFVTRQNFIYKELLNNPYYTVFKGNRMMSTHFHPTPLGTYLVAIFPLTVILLLKEKNIFLKLLSIIYAIVIFISVILTFSRGVLLGVSMGVSIIVFFLVRRKKTSFILALILLIVTIVGLSSLLFRYGNSSFYRYSLQGLLQEYIYSMKITRFIALGQILKEYPFFGAGFGHFRVLFDYYLPHLAKVCSYDGKVADCMYITILAETGLVGFGGFLLFIYFLFKRVWKSLKLPGENENRLFLVCFLAGFVGIICTFLTYDGLYWNTPAYLFWTYAGIISSLSTPKLPMKIK